MMKKLLLPLFLCFSFGSVFTQPINLEEVIPGPAFADARNGFLAMGDIDNDGDEDVLICGMGASGLNLSNLYENDGTGGFTLVAGTSFPTTFLGTSDFADFDRDGDFDILVTGAVQGATFASNIYENQGGNNFVLIDSLVDVYLSDTGIEDIDGDNDLDVIVIGISGLTSPFTTRTYLNLTPVGIEEENLSANAYLYPNPSQGVFHWYTNQKGIGKLASLANYFFRGPVSWSIRTYSKIMRLPATYSSQGSHFTREGRSMGEGKN